MMNTKRKDPDVAAAVVLLAIIGVVAAVPFALSIYGIILAFRASLVIGFLALLLEPSPLIFGAAKFFFDTDLAQALATSLGL